MWKLSLLSVVAMAALPIPMLAQSSGPDWVGGHFYSCQDTELRTAHYRNNTFYGEGVDPTPVPLTRFDVIGTRVQKEEDGSDTVLLLVQSGTGAKSVVALQYVLQSMYPRERVATVLPAYVHGMSELPKEWSLAELGAIQMQRPIKGMNRRQVQCSLGVAQHTNDYGAGEVQEVYLDGALLVYWGPAETVTAVQTFR